MAVYVPVKLQLYIKQLADFAPGLYFANPYSRVDAQKEKTWRPSLFFAPICVQPLHI